MLQALLNLATAAVTQNSTGKKKDLDLSWPIINRSGLQYLSSYKIHCFKSTVTFVTGFGFDK